ncbi:TPA: hypothetical protein ACGQ50_000824 [Enterobacter cloacae]
MSKATITNEQLRTRIEALRNTKASVIASTAVCDADALEELLKLRAAVRKDRILVQQDENCDCDDDCDCTPTLFVTVNGMKGYGSATWTYQEQRGAGLAYFCQFMGFEFWATDHSDAADQLRQRLSWLGDKVEVLAW